MMHHSFCNGFGFSMHEHRLLHFADNNEKPADASAPKHTSQEFKKAFEEMLQQPGAKDEVKNELLELFRKNAQLKDSLHAAQKLRDRLSSLSSLENTSNKEVQKLLREIPNDTLSLINFSVDHGLFKANEIWAAGLQVPASNPQEMPSKERDTRPFEVRSYERGKPKRSPTNAPRGATTREGVPVATYVPRSGSHYDKATRTMIHADGRVERLEDIRARLDQQHAEIAYRNQMQHNRNVANGRLVQNWRSNPLGVEAQLRNERTAAQFGITPEQMYNPVTGTEAAFNAHVQRAARGGNPVFMNESGTRAYVDSDVPRTRIDARTGMIVDNRGAYNEWMANGDPRSNLGMPNAHIFTADGAPMGPVANDVRGIYGARANRAPAGNITPFNRYDTNTPESQREIKDFYQNENIRRLQSNEFDDLKAHKNPAVRKAYSDIVSAFNDGIMKRGKVEYHDTALARTRMENLRRNAEMMTNNDSIGEKGEFLAQRYYPVHGFAGDAPVRIEYETEFRGRTEKRNISIHDPRMWGDGIYGAKGSADNATEGGIRVVQEKLSDGKVKGLALEFTKPGIFTVTSRGPGGKVEQEKIVVTDLSVLPPDPQPDPEAAKNIPKNMKPVPEDTRHTPAPRPTEKDVPKTTPPTLKTQPVPPSEPEKKPEGKPTPKPVEKPVTPPKNVPPTQPESRPKSTEPQPEPKKPEKVPETKPQPTPTPLPEQPSQAPTPEKPSEQIISFPEKIETKQQMEEAIASIKSRAEKLGNKDVMKLFSDGNGRVQEMGPGKKPQMLFKKDQIDTLKSMQSDVGVKPVLGAFVSVEDPASLLNAIHKKLEPSRSPSRRRGKSSPKKTEEAAEPVASEATPKTEIKTETKTEEVADALSAIPAVETKTETKTETFEPADAFDALPADAKLTNKQKEMISEGSDPATYEDLLVDAWNNADSSVKPVLDKFLDMSRKTTYSPSAAEKHADAVAERSELRTHADVWLDSNVKYVFLGRVQYLNTLVHETQTTAEIEKEFREYIES